ncbi:M3 family metallopeptidase [Eudoraea chungangensis]|uniref:M3 family metallopeptidase n=1 Tax=Eudoraea chungangensis TaxID=1481905 RepID=UPI0023EACB93|nr:M3 family metallopeptidase [Eudoraea chungangensis]
MNPLLKPFDVPPFSKLNDSHYKPAFLEALKIAEKEVETIANSEEEATFENTIEALEFSGQQLERVASLFFNLNSAETNDKIQEIAKDISPLLAKFSNDIVLNEKLFGRIKYVFETIDKNSLSAEENTLLEKKYKNFSRNGANLKEEQKLRLREIDAKLAPLKLQFGENVLKETQSYELHITREEDLAGLPESVKEAAAQIAQSNNKSGWIITLDYPSYIPFMKYASNRALRKELSTAFGAKAFHGDSLDNQNNVLSIAKLRHERAQLLGYKSHAHFILEERMAETPENVFEFLDNLLIKAKPAALRELNELTDFAKGLDGVERLESWDAAYYSEKLKQHLFQFNDEVLKPFFELDRVIAGVFKITENLYGLRFEEVFDVETYHPEVKTYRIYDQNGAFISLFFADFHPREGKRAGAWMTSFKSQYILKGKNERPLISNVCNFTKPTKEKPSLLTFNEVTTLFHEFGHALHGILANTTYPSLSGTSVYWDFVELPSQILENWCYEEDALKLFAIHYKTKEPLPMGLVKKIKDAAKFQEGMATLRQISFGLLDMSWHAQDPSDIKSVKEHELKAFEKTALYPDNAETCMSTSFSHIFQGGYSAGYYSYKWAEVLDADAFDYFKTKGVFNKEIAAKFKENILSKGGTEKPMVLYKRFRGREPQIDALLKRAGLTDVSD